VPKKVILDVEPWTPENDMVTAAFKLKRQNLVAAFRQRIDAQY
jgi:long-chain acyl-CoA synthetase/cryptochrome